MLTASIEEDSDEGFETAFIEGRQVTPPSHTPEECQTRPFPYCTRSIAGSGRSPRYSTQWRLMHG
jgi:hypothetical protein